MKHSIWRLVWVPLYCAILCMIGLGATETWLLESPTNGRHEGEELSSQVRRILAPNPSRPWNQHREKAEKISSLGTDAVMLTAQMLLSDGGLYESSYVLPVLRELKRVETVPVLLEFIALRTTSDSDAEYEALQLLADFGGTASVPDAVRLMNNSDRRLSIRLAAARICLRYGNDKDHEEARTFVEATWRERQDQLGHAPFPYEPEGDQNQLTLTVSEQNQIILSAWDLQDSTIQHDILEWFDEEEVLTWNDFGVLQELYEPSIERFKTILLKSIASDTFIGNYPTLVPDAIAMLIEGFPEVKRSDKLMAHLRERYMVNFRAYDGIFEDPETAYPELYQALFLATKTDR